MGAYVPGAAKNGIGAVQPDGTATLNSSLTFKAIKQPAHPPSTMPEPATKTGAPKQVKKQVNPAQPGPTTPPEVDVYPYPAGNRRPRGYLLIGSAKCAIVSFNVLSTGHFTPDTWQAELDLYQQPQGFDFAFWSDQADQGTLVQVMAGFLLDTQDVADWPSNPTSLITGQIDDVDLTVDQSIVRLSGRDLTAPLVDNKTANRWPDQTSSQIVTRIAKQFGLKPQVTATKTAAGVYYKDAYASMTDPTPYWDLITLLAQQEGFDAYVSGQTLYFGPPQADSDPNPWTLYMKSDGQGRYWSNAKTLTLHRSLTLAKDISVTVLSHNSRTGRSVKETATRAGVFTGSSSRSKSAASVQSYVIDRPGLNSAQAQQLANSELAQISKFERTFMATIEGDTSLTIRRMLKITGTGTKYDQNYYGRQITRSWEAEGGLLMTVSAKNVPTQNEATV